MWGNEPPNAKVSGQMKWVLRAQQMEKDYGSQVYHIPEFQKPAATAKGAGQAPKESNGLFDATFAQDYYRRLYTQGKQEHNLFKLAGGSLGGGIATNYLDVAGLAQRGVEASADLVVSGQNEGGLSGLAKQGVGYTTGFFGSLATEQNLPSTLTTVGMMGFGGRGCGRKPRESIDTHSEDDAGRRCLHERHEHRSGYQRQEHVDRARAVSGGARI